MKQSTEAIRQFLMERINSPELKTSIINTLEREGVLNLSCIDGEEAWSLWIDPKSWKRGYKRRVGAEVGQYFNEDRSFITSYDDGKGHHSVAAGQVNQVALGHSRCWVRQFVHTNEVFGNNYSIYVVTSPDDENIVGWHLHEDR